MVARLDPIRRFVRTLAIYLGFIEGASHPPRLDTRSRMRKILEFTTLAALIALVVGARLTATDGLICFAMLVFGIVARELFRLDKPRDSERATLIANTVGIALTTLPVAIFLHAAFSRDDPFAESVGYGVVFGLAFAVGTAYENKQERRRRATTVVPAP